MRLLCIIPTHGRHSKHSPPPHIRHPPPHTQYSTSPAPTGVSHTIKHKTPTHPHLHTPTHLYTQTQCHRIITVASTSMSVTVYYSSAALGAD